MIPRVIAGTSRTFLLTGLTRYQSRVTLVPQNYHAPKSVPRTRLLPAANLSFQLALLDTILKYGESSSPHRLGNEDTRTPWRKWTSYARIELSYCLPAHIVISMISNTANSFCPPPLVVRFSDEVSPEMTARSLVLPTADTASINK